MVKLTEAALVVLGALAVSSVWASEDGEKFSEDATEDKDFGGSLFQEEGRPNVVFYSAEDSDVYCLVFERFFEVSDYSSGDDYEEVDGKKMQFKDSDWSYDVNNDSATQSDWLYRIRNTQSPIDDWITNLNFSFREDLILLSGETDETYAFKFDIKVGGYTFSDTNNKFVIAFSLEKCDDEHGSERIDSDESANDDDEEGLLFHFI